MTAIVLQRLTLIICAVVILCFSARRKWLSPTETGWVGGTMIFPATTWMLQAVLNVTRSDFPNHVQAIVIGVALVAPLDLALVFGLVILVRRLKAETLSP